jgi:hypothetical protein
MTRADVKQQQDEMFPGKMLPEICLNLRQALNGTSEAWPDDAVGKTVHLLRDVLTTWAAPTFADDGPMDTCVYRLVGETVAYADRRNVAGA